MQFQHAGDLKIIGHEYTHYLEVMYGFTSDANWSAVFEGVADTFAVRYAAWKKAKGDWTSLTYQTDLNLFGFYHHVYQQALRNGEYRIETHPVPLAAIDGYLYLDPAVNPLCYQPGIGQEIHNRYRCGELLQNIYWALAFNQCRLSYLSCTSGSALLSGVGYWQQRPIQVAADAFTYAMAIADPATLTMQAFVSLVAARYNEYKVQGHITNADLQRVNSLLSSHCTGPSNVCPSYLKNPGSPLPRQFTTKKDYYEAEAGVLFSPAQSVPTVTRSADAYLRMNSGGMAMYTVNLPQNGMYRFNLLAQINSSTEDEVNALAFDGRNWRNLGPMPMNGYAWYPRDSAPERFCAWSTRPTTLLLSTIPSHMQDFKLDVAVLERVGNLEGNCVLQCSAGFQGCPSGMTCNSGVCQ